MDRGVLVIDICITVNLLAGTISELLLLYIIYKISVHAGLIKQSIAQQNSHYTTNSSEITNDDTNEYTGYPSQNSSFLLK